MEITFIGVGEACDSDYPNTSLLLKSGDGGRHVLLDCGFTTPHLYFKLCAEADALAALWISHFHGDHFLGVPLLLLRFWEMNRRQPLYILGPAGIGNKINAVMELAYPVFLGQLQYPLHFLEVEPGHTVGAGGLNWRTAENRHSQRALAVRIDDGEKSLFYSGDGRPTKATLALARGCDLIVHEAYRFSGETEGHGTVSGCLEFAAQAGAPNLALLHMQRHDRSCCRKQIEQLLRSATCGTVFLPEPGDSFIL